MQVSVPSRGLSYLNMNNIQIFKNNEFGFRPLTGTLLSKPTITASFLITALGFRPLTGTLLSKRFINLFLTAKENCFRPLTGTLLSKR